MLFVLASQCGRDGGVCLSLPINPAMMGAGK
jgi:hypothetical protein